MTHAQGSLELPLLRRTALQADEKCRIGEAAARHVSDGETGFTDFNGQTYGVPMSSNRLYGTMTLYNADYMQHAGYDPTSEPLTWDTFREAARTVTEQGQGQYYGLTFEGNQPNRFSAFVPNLARMAGASAVEEDIDWRTGQHILTSDQYLAGLDLLLALEADGSIFPGSLSPNAPQARAQMPLGTAGMILQGPWNIPQWKQDSPDFQFGVANRPLPNSGEAVPLTVARVRKLLGVRPESA